MDSSTNIQRDDSSLSRPIQFCDRSQSPLLVEAITATLTQKHQKLTEFRLILQVDLDCYQRIDRDALFNFQAEVRTPISKESFQSDLPIQIDLSLKPEWLSRIAEHAQTSAAALEYLVQLSQIQTQQDAEREASEIDPILLTESWLALSVVQTITPDRVAGYRTFWSYVNPEVLASEAPDREQVTAGITQFFNELVDTELSSIAESFAEDTVSKISNFFQEIAGIADVKGSEPESSPLSIFDATMDFFTKDDWSFLRIQGETALRLAFAGANGRWNCYASAREEQQQLIFYSICPIGASEERHAAIAEFLTRANYGMILGNFELDYSDGEIRYKTSIDVEGDTLTSALVRNLVYTNVTMMDRYLPGILAILEQGATPVQAIRLVEQNEPIP